MAETTIPIIMENCRADAINNAPIDSSFETNTAKLLAKFDDGLLIGTTDIHTVVPIPANYSTGSLTLKIKWKSLTATTGNVLWNVYSSTPFTNGTDLTAITNAVIYNGTAATAVAGTVSYLTLTNVTLTGTPSAGKFLLFRISRVGNQANDTMVGFAYIESIDFIYTSDSSIAKVYRWFPSQAIAISSVAVTAGCVRGSATYVTTSSYNIRPQFIALRHSFSDYIDIRFSLPNNFGGNLNTTVVGVSTAAANNVYLQQAMGAAGIGASYDPALTSSTAVAIAAGAANIAFVDSNRAAPISPVARDAISYRLTRLGSNVLDVSTGDLRIFGIMFTFDIILRNPGTVEMDPGSGSLPNSNSMSIQLLDDTNLSKYVAVAATGLDQEIHFTRTIPHIYSAGGTYRVRWVANAASGTAKFQLSMASPAVGADSDPALVVLTTVSSTCTGVNLINEFTIDASAGLAASDMFNGKLKRLGATGSESGAVASADIKILDCFLESNVA